MLAGDDGDSALSLDCVDEQPRLDELRRYDLERDVADPALDRLAELAARVCHAPIGVISAIDDRYQRFLARWGIASEIGGEILRQDSICASTLSKPESLLVLDELAQSRYANLPVVRGLGLTFYAGAPLVTPSGYVLGTVCVVDKRQRTLDPAEARGLSLVRDQIMELLEARRELGELRRSEALRQEAVEALVATQRDLSHRIELRTRDIAAAHHKTRELLERIGDGYVVLDRAWNYVYINQRGAQLFGRTPDELIGKHIWTEFPEGVGQPFQRAYERALKEQVALTLEACYQPWNRWFENRIYPSADGVAVFFTEVTERRRAEQEAEKVQRRLVEAQRVAHVGSWEWDVGADSVTWSDELYRIYDVPIGSPLGGYEGFLSRVHPDDLAQTKRTIASAVEHGAHFIYDHRIVRPDGSVRMLHTRGEAIVTDGKLARLVGCCWDVTELAAATRASRATAALFAATLQVVDEAVVVVDDAGNVSAHNAQAKAFVPLPAALVDSARRLGAHDVSDATVTLSDGRRVQARSRPHVVDGRVVGRVWGLRPLPSTA
jgi:PAS domain S-box-containing protein